jgi:hypothetical protein
VSSMPFLVAIQSPNKSSPSDETLVALR